MITSGSIIIPNDLGKKTILLITENGRIIADPPDNALPDALAALDMEKRSPSVRLGNIAFLNYWIRLFSRKQTIQSEIQNLTKYYKGKKRRRKKRKK